MAEAAKERHRNPSYRLALATITEDQTDYSDKMEPVATPTPIELEMFMKLTSTEKMEKLVEKFNMLCIKTKNIDEGLVDENTGLATIVATAQTQVDQACTDILELKWENSILKGLVQKQAKQIESLNSKVLKLTARSMDKNVIITGIQGDNAKENCKSSVTNFLKQVLEIEVKDEEIIVAYRKGMQRQKIARPMLVHCQYPLKERIFQNVKNLKEKVNEIGDSYYINKQLPDALVEKNKEIRENVKQQKDLDKALPPAQRSKIEVRNKTVFIDGQPVEKQLLPPQLIEMFADRAECDKREKIKFAVSDTTSLKGSDFIAFAFKTGQLNEVKRAYRKVRSMHPSADHVIAAYNLKNTAGYQDDDEYGASAKLLKYLKENRPLNTVVFVVRYKHGENIGSTRFELIEQVATQATSRLK